MTPYFIDRGPFTVIGLGGNFTPFDAQSIGALWDAFLAQKQNIPTCQDAVAFGVCRESTSATKTPDQFRYTACVQVDATAAVPNSMEKITIPAQHYAVFTHKGLIKDLRQTIDYIWQTWLPNSDYQHVPSPDFELYDERWTGDDVTSELDLYIPVKRRA